MDVKFDIKGLPELKRRLDTLSDDMRYKGGRFALRKAAQAVRDQAKQNALRLDDEQTGRSIADNIAERWNSRLFKQTGNLGFRVGILKGAVLPEKGERVDFSAGAQTPHWRLLEFGTQKMPAQPFMRPAIQKNLTAISEIFVTQYNLALDRALKRQANAK